MSQISPLAWAAIAVIVVITIIINFGMIAMLRSRDRNEQFGRKFQARSSHQVADSLRKITDVMRDPYREDQKQMDELSDLVSHLHESPRDPLAAGSGEEGEKPSQSKP